MSKHSKNSAEMDNRWIGKEEEKISKRNQDSLEAENSNNSHNDKGKAVQSRPAVRVEYPQEGAVIAQTSYTFNITAVPEADSVEVSIDHGNWMPCREALGTWWYDWSGFEKGEHDILARTRSGNGLSTNSSIRKFSVN